MPPENMPLWHKDYCELKAIEKQIGEKLSAFLLMHKFINMSLPL